MVVTLGPKARKQSIGRCPKSKMRNGAQKLGAVVLLLNWICLPTLRQLGGILINGRHNGNHAKVKTNVRVYSSKDPNISSFQLMGLLFSRRASFP